MARVKTSHVCTECGAASSKWQGQCPGCGLWNTLVETVAAALGERYARKVPIGLLTDERESAKDANSAMMELAAARFFYTSEANRAMAWNTARVKEVTGGERQSGRQLYGAQQNFKVAATGVVASNYELRTDCTDHGFWRRMLFYRPKVTFKERPNPANPYEREARPEFNGRLKADPLYLEGVLAFLVHNFAKLRRKYGGNIARVPSPTVERETEEYRNRLDVVNRFITQGLAADPAAPARPLREVVAWYLEWYRANVNARAPTDLDALAGALENSRLGSAIVRRADGALEVAGYRARLSAAEAAVQGALEDL
ncbi:MAG: hypothetical protein EBS23_08480 [Betaproteobacteria bacterium]|nr:hypothetical protein [Betaproteobacteria bacterium]